MSEDKERSPSSELSTVVCASARSMSTEIRPQSGSEGIGMCLVFTHSEAGGHPTNEDAFEVQRHPEVSWRGRVSPGARSSRTISRPSYFKPPTDLRSRQRIA
jgi:hypothetical protein